MLQEQADTSDSNPAAETHKERFAACFHQLHDVGIETDGCHGQYDEELGKFFDRRKEVSRHAHRGGYGGDDGGCDEVEDEEWEDIFHRNFFPRCFIFFLLFSCPPNCQNQSNRDDSQGSGQFDGDGLIQGSSAQIPHAVPGRGACCDGRSIVDSRSCKDAEGFPEVVSNPIACQMPEI